MSSDDEFLSAFEARTYPVEDFHHREHVRLAWIYLERYPLLEALTRFRSSLLAFVAHHGASDKFHETITWSFLFLINERRSRHGGDWVGFQAENPDLLDWSNNALERYYRPETLASDLARSTFVLPDRVG